MPKGDKMHVLEMTDAEIMLMINDPVRSMTVRQLKAVARYEGIKLTRSDRNWKPLLCKRIIQTRELRKAWAEAMASHGQTQ